MGPSRQGYQEIISLQEIVHLDLQINLPDVMQAEKAKMNPVLRPAGPQEAILTTILSKGF